MARSRWSIWQDQTIKELRTQYTELSRRMASVNSLNTALRNENAKLRREIARLGGSAAVNPHGDQKAKARAKAKTRSETKS